MPEWIEVLVPESEKEQYINKIKNPLITIPDKYKGLGQVRNWVLKNFENDIIIMFDDDINRMDCLSGDLSERITDQQQIMQILINASVMAKDMGVHFFGFSQGDIRTFNGTDPFNLNTWFGGVVGVIGRKYKFRDDKFKVDIDYCLQNLLVDRIVFCDTRYLFRQKRDSNIGGNSEFRTEEAFIESVNSLKDKWGDALKVREFKSQINIKINVKRKQRIQL